MLIFEVILLIVLISLSALFSASETALTSISKLRIKHLILERGNKAKNLNIWLNNPTRILTIILVLNNVVNIAASSFTTVLTMKYFSETGEKYFVGIAIGLLTFIILVGGEIVPKNLARKYSEEIAIKVIKLLDFLAFIFKPLITILIKISNLVIKSLNLPYVKSQKVVTEQEIKMMIEVGQREGVVEKAEREMLMRIFRFNDIPVKDVMTKKDKMVCGNLNMDIKDIIDLITIEGHSRIPVYSSTIDDIIGIIYDRDILYCIKENKLIKISDIIRPPYKVNKNVMIDDLLHDFQKKSIQIAIVIDEEGKTIGLVTIEDLIEEIVGEIDEKLVLRKG